MSNLHPRDDFDAKEVRAAAIDLKNDAKCSNDLTIDEAADLAPSEVKGPSILERAGEEFLAMAAAAKSSISGVFAGQSKKAEEKS